MLTSLNILIPVAVTLFTWGLNEYAKRRFERYKRKEASYRELINSLHGFYIGAENAEALKNNFLKQFNMAWLYCPDEVIKKGNSFLDTINSTRNRSSHKLSKEEALGECEFILAIRNDLMPYRLFQRNNK